MSLTRKFRSFLSKIDIVELFIKFTSVLLISVMIYPRGKPYYYRLLHILVSLFSGLVSSITCAVKIHYLETGSEKLSCFLYLIDIIDLTVFSIAWMRNKEIIQELVDLLKVRGYKYNNVQQELVYQKKIEEIRRPFLMICYAFGVIYYTSFFFMSMIYLPAIIYLYGKQNVDDYTQYLLFTAWYPYSLGDYSNFCFTLIFQLATIGILLYCSASSITLAIYVHLMTEAEKEALTYMIGQIETMVENRLKPLIQNEDKSGELWYGVKHSKWQKVYDDAFLKLLGECINHHRCIIRLIQLFRRCYTLVTNMVLLSAGLVTSICVYTLISESLAFSIIVERFLQSMLFMGSSFIYCFIGEYMGETNQTFVDAIYSDTHWYAHSVRIKKSVYLIQNTYLWEPRMTFMSKYTFSYPLYMSMVKGVYTYLNFLLDMVEK